MLVGCLPFVDAECMDEDELLDQIERKRLVFPTDGSVSPSAQEFVKNLLKPDKKKRLGCSKNGVARIKNHKFYEGLDFEALSRRELAAPLYETVLEKIGNETDGTFEDALTVLAGDVLSA
ncbi:Chromosomal serine/threonine-protein kinase jil-1 [Blyttiomyces sp. JEL0837]|nr:Chromosomal serine/threonine-protein kinase jil-1 [Blyttiomyces sp. JEL0837]